jgi:putative DNA primase/helicase
MLDFNDTTPPPAPVISDAERDAIRAELLARLESVLTTLFPAGKKRRGKFLIGDVLGSPGDSLEVVLDGDKAGLWTDRATGDGGDIFALIAATSGIGVLHDFPRVLDAAADLLGRASKPVRKRQQEGRAGRRTRPGHRQVGLPRRGRHLIAVVYRYDPPGQKKEFRPGMPSAARWHRPTRARSTTSRGWPAPRRWCWSKARNARRP